MGALTSATPFHSFVKKGEEYLCKLFGVNHVILMNNGTSATHCLFLALKFKYPYLKKIYLPNHVYVAAWNTALYEYDSSQLEILPIDSKSLNMIVNEDYLQTLEKNSALVIVHNVGNIVNVPYIQQIRPDLIIVEDNCEGLFGKYGSRYTGTLGLCSSISFFANKTITCGEGGAFVTNDKDVYEYIRKVYNQGMTSERYVHDVLGYNYRITNLQAALLYPQLVDHVSIIEAKKKIFNTYRSLITHPAVMWPEKDQTTEESYWMVILRIKGSVFDETLRYFSEHYIEIRPFFYDIYRHKHLRCIKTSFEPFLESKEWIMIPSYPTLELPQIEYISRTVNSYATYIATTILSFPK
jgi:perosamine synthetase